MYINKPMHFIKQFISNETLFLRRKFEERLSSKVLSIKEYIFVVGKHLTSRRNRAMYQTAYKPKGISAVWKAFEQFAHIAY